MPQPRFYAVTMTYVPLDEDGYETRDAAENVAQEEGRRLGVPNLYHVITQQEWDHYQSIGD